MNLLKEVCDKMSFYSNFSSLIDEKIYEYMSQNVTREPTLIIIHPITCEDFCEGIRHVVPQFDVSPSYLKYKGYRILRSQDVPRNEVLIA